VKPLLSGKPQILLGNRRTGELRDDRQRFLRPWRGQSFGRRYVRLGGFIHVNTAECRFSLMKRAVFGMHHSISEAHLPRYLSEWDYKWNTRKISDAERAAIASKEERANGCNIDSLVKPRTLKQKAHAFMRWRNRQ
jgi:ISXO2-like transposase domain